MLACLGFGHTYMNFRNCPISVGLKTKQSWAEKCSATDNNLWYQSHSLKLTFDIKKHGYINIVYPQNKQIHQTGTWSMHSQSNNILWFQWVWNSFKSLGIDLSLLDKPSSYKEKKMSNQFHTSTCRNWLSDKLISIHKIRQTVCIISSWKQCQSEFYLMLYQACVQNLIPYSVFTHVQKRRTGRYSQRPHRHHRRLEIIQAVYSSPSCDRIPIHLQ